MTTDGLIAALADGELDLRQQPEAFARLAQDPQAAQQFAQRVADQQAMKAAVGSAMCGPQMQCPDALKQAIRAMAGSAPATTSPATAPAPAASPVANTASHRPTVLARIGRWAPAAVAAVLLLAAGVLFQQASQSAGTTNSPMAVLTTHRVNNFASRHSDCAKNPDILKDHDSFGQAAALETLPGKLSDYFRQSSDGMNLDLSRVGYDYQMTGACSLPGSGAVHLVYRHHDNPNRSMSLWLKPDDGALKIEPGRLYVEAGDNLDHPVILWKSNDLIFYLVGDSLEDAHLAVDELRQRV